jgi:hypothetical protein
VQAAIGQDAVQARHSEHHQKKQDENRDRYLDQGKCPAVPHEKSYALTGESQDARQPEPSRAQFSVKKTQ